MSDQKQMVRLIGAQENLRRFAKNWKHRVKWMYLNTETGQVRGDNKNNVFKICVIHTLCQTGFRNFSSVAIVCRVKYIFSTCSVSYEMLNNFSVNRVSIN